MSHYEYEPKQEKRQYGQYEEERQRPFLQLPLPIPEWIPEELPEEGEEEQEARRVIVIDL